MEPHQRVGHDIVWSCEKDVPKQEWLQVVMGHTCILTDAEELGGTTAMTSTGMPARIAKAESLNGGWVCSQNSTVSPEWHEMQDLVSVYGEESGETELFFGNALSAQNMLWGFGENVRTSVFPRCNVS